jgi:hypothetical protein
MDFRLIGFLVSLTTLFKPNLALKTPVVDASSLNELSFIQFNGCVNYIASIGRKIMNDEFAKMWEKMVMVYCKVLS